MRVTLSPTLGFGEDLTDHSRSELDIRRQHAGRAGVSAARRGRCPEHRGGAEALGGPGRASFMGPLQTSNPAGGDGNSCVLRLTCTLGYAKAGSSGLVGDARPHVKPTRRARINPPSTVGEASGSVRLTVDLAWWVLFGSSFECDRERVQCGLPSQLRALTRNSNSAWQLALLRVSTARRGSGCAPLALAPGEATNRDAPRHRAHARDQR
jgi:hypothetical protein